MGFLNRLLKGTAVKQEEEELSNALLLREAIVPTETFLSEYRKWKQQDMATGLLMHLKESCERRMADPQASVNYFVHQSALSNGFYFRAESPWNTKDYAFLVQLFIEKLQAQNYVLKNSLREVHEEEETLTTEESFYLKPSLKYRRKLPYQQLFGNVSIEHQQKEGHTVLVKVLVNTYSDQSYAAPYYYEDFLNELFRTDKDH